MTKDIVESQRVKKIVRPRVKQCYANAAKVVLALSEYADAEYVEGLAVIEKAMVIEHGWVERDGVIGRPSIGRPWPRWFPTTCRSIRRHLPIEF